MSGMILATRNGFDHQVSRGSPGGSNGYYVHALRAQSKTNPLSLPTVASVIRLISGTIGSFVMRTYTGDASRREPLLDTPQAAVLQDAAPGYCTSMDLWRDTVTSIEIWGTALIWKGKDDKGNVTELYPFPAESSWIYVNRAGDRIVEATVNGQRIDITENVIVVRGWSPIPSVTGESKLRQHRRTLEGAVQVQEHRGRYFNEDSTPNLVLTGPNSMTPQQRAELRDSWKIRGSGGTAVLWQGVTVQQLTSTLAESQLAELSTYDVAEIARMFSFYPASLLSVGEERVLPDAENLTKLFHRMTLLERLRTIERAVSGDRELFPDRSVYAQFDTWKFTAGSVTATAQMVHMLKQDGVMTGNEGRSFVDLPPSDDPAADKLLETPVGAAPNAATGDPNA